MKELTPEIMQQIKEIVQTRLANISDSEEMAKFMIQCLCADYVAGITIPEMEE